MTSPIHHTPSNDHADSNHVWSAHALQSFDALTQSIALDEAPMTGTLRSALVIIATVVTGFLVWAFFAPVEEVASVNGQVIPSGYVQTIQHPDGGIIKEILIQDGDLVEKGQPLFRLDATDAGADLGQIKARQKALRAQATRLKAYTADSTMSPVKTTSLTKQERDILDSMEQARNSQRQVLHDQIAQKEKDIRTLQETASTLKKNMALKERENAMYTQAVKDGTISQMMALSSEQSLNEISGQYQETISQAHRAQDALREARNRLQSLDADLKQDAMKNLGQVEAELAELDKSIIKLEGAAARTTIYAPVRGLIKGMNVHTLGAVIKSGTVLTEIVPVEKDLLIEALVPPSDIGNVKNGQLVRIKVSAYDFSRFGNVTGSLKTVSASTFQDDDEKSFYKALVRLDQQYVGKDPDRNLILPGMTVQASIITGKKTVLEYLLKPMHQAMSGAFHER